MHRITQADVVVIGSGFGGSVAALRFAQAGYSVVVLERGDRVSRERFQFDLDVLWKPHRASYGFHDLHSRGKNILPWLGAAVGGGSHVYAGTLKRRESWEGFPTEIRAADMKSYYETAEDMLGGTLYPNYPPYSDVRAAKLMFEADKRLAELEPELVEEWGPVNLGISFAPADGSARPGDEFVNRYGCKQRYYDPSEQSIVGGDIGSKNSLDCNYLFLAERAGAVIQPLCEADRLEKTADGRWQVSYRRHLPTSGWARFRQRWLSLHPKARMSGEGHVVARRVVVACGAIGSSELLMRNHEVHGTLPSLGAPLGTRYTTNGDYLSLIVPFRLLVPVWLTFVALVACLVTRQWLGAGVAAALHYLGLWASGPPYDADIGTTNTESLQFRGPRGESQYAYIESGRYPTPGRAILAFLITKVTGRFRPMMYRAIIAVSRILRFMIPPFGALARSYPIALLQMGKDDAYGKFRLGRDGRATINYDLAANRSFYAYHDLLAKKLARVVRAYWLRNPLYVLLKKQEVPHNQGGVPMGDSPASGVVDHAGRVFGETNFMVLDGSIIPESVGPNPALTIVAIAERAMEIVLAQLKRGEEITAEPQEVTCRPGS
jgi:cholesterol oxidase